MQTCNQLQMLDTKTTRKISRVPRSTLVQWVCDGDVMPAMRGGKGRGNSDRYTYGQVLGLIMAQALRETIGCRLEQVRALAQTSDEEFLRQFEDWQAGNVYRDEGDDLWSDEEGAIAKHRLSLFDVAQQQFGKLFVERSGELFAYYHARQLRTQQYHNERTMQRTARATK